MRNSKQLAKLWGCTEKDILRTLTKVFLRNHSCETSTFPFKMELTEDQLKAIMLNNGLIKEQPLLKLITR